MPVEVRMEDRVAVVTLDRPDAHNALNSEMREGLAGAWARIREDDEIRAVVLTGAGERAFCAGADLKEQRDSEPSFAAQTYSGQGDAHLLRGMEFDKPLVGALNGHALGGGLELALGCDIRIAADHATLGLPEVRVGSMPGAGGTQNLPRTVGMSDAMYLLLTGERITADHALRIGLVSECLAAEDLMERAHGIAATIARNAPLSVRATKRLAKHALDLPHDRGLELERQAWGLVRATEDRAEGRRAFREKRTPQYRGA